jgi:transaldolase
LLLLSFWVLYLDVVQEERQLVVTNTEKQTFIGPLHEMAMTTATDYWNDSSSVEELTYAIERGAVGATSNPTIVISVFKKEMHLWRERIFQLIAEYPTWTEEQVALKIFEEIAVNGAKLLLPVFEKNKHKKGRLSIQTDPRLYRNSKALVEQAVHFSKLAPNMQVKIPVTKAGITAIEEATYQGVSINATVSFTVPQCLAVAEAVERGLNRRQAEGKDISEMSPVCTIMVGRLDDWLQVIAKKENLPVNPGYPLYAGIACVKKLYPIWKERGYRARILSAAYRHIMHWTDLIGGDMIHTIPYNWQLMYNASGFKVHETLSVPVRQEIVDTLYKQFPDFRKAYDVDGMTIDEFDSYGSTVRTLRGFIASYLELMGVIRDFMLPNPD